MNHIWTATTKDEGLVQFWASIDGDKWLPIDREAGQDDYDDLLALFTPTIKKEGDREIRLHTITFARRYLEVHLKAEFGTGKHFHAA